VIELSLRTSNPPSLQLKSMIFFSESSLPSLASVRRPVLLTRAVARKRRQGESLTYLVGIVENFTY